MRAHYHAVVRALPDRNVVTELARETMTEAQKAVYAMNTLTMGQVADLYSGLEVVHEARSESYQIISCFNYYDCPLYHGPKA